MENLLASLVLEQGVSCVLLHQGGKMLSEAPHNKPVVDVHSIQFVLVTCSRILGVILIRTNVRVTDYSYSFELQVILTCNLGSS